MLVTVRNIRGTRKAEDIQTLLFLKIVFRHLVVFKGLHISTNHNKLNLPTHDWVRL
jgi:hypothetical protein